MLTVAQLVKTLPAFYGLRFIAMVTTTPLFLILSHLNPIDITLLHFNTEHLVRERGEGEG
jgi:hypothetical protein